eukprot:4470907-Amphidinium_carterae.1
MTKCSAQVHLDGGSFLHSVVQAFAAISIGVMSCLGLVARSSSRLGHTLGTAKAVPFKVVVLYLAKLKCLVRLRCAKST